MSAIILTDPSNNPLGTISLTIERGIDSAHVQLKIKNGGGTNLVGRIVSMYVENPASSGQFLSSGLPVVDEVMGRFQITSVDSSGTPGQEFLSGVVQPMGHLQSAALPTILPGNSIFADFWLSQGGSSAAGGSFNLQIEIGAESHAQAVPGGLTEVGRGVLSGKNEPVSFWINGRVVTATGTPDDKVHAAPGGWLIGGVEYSDATTQNITLDQNDGAAAALATGESYIALISQSSSAIPTVTKGLKASSSPVPPNLPAGNLYLATVVVNYHAGTSVIQPTDIQQSLLYNRYLAIAPTSGLTLDLYAGEALAANYHLYHEAKETLTLTPSVTNYIWETPSGVQVTTTNVQPVPGALPLWHAVTDATHVTSLVDDRQYVGVLGSLTPHAATHAVGGSDPVSPASIGAAPIISPDFTGGTPLVPTQAPGDNTTKAASTAFVTAAVAATVEVLFDHVSEFVGNASAQPSALSPVPHPNTLPLVFVNGLNQREDTPGGTKDYKRTGANLENILFTPVLPLGQVCKIWWRATT